MLPAGWYEPFEVPAPAPRHCYRTLAEADCHAAPLPGAAHRKLGFFDAPVAD